MRGCNVLNAVRFGCRLKDITQVGKQCSLVVTGWTFARYRYTSVTYIPASRAQVEL